MIRAPSSIDDIEAALLMCGRAAEDLPQPARLILHPPIDQAIRACVAARLAALRAPAPFFLRPARRGEMS